MNKQLTALSLFALAPLCASAFDFTTPAGFENARRPMTNPVFFDLAIPRTTVHPIFMYHELPDQVNIIGGGKVPMGGDLQLYALQFEIALNEQFSIVAAKDGFIDFNPSKSGAFTQSTGFADLGLGIKHAFYRDDAEQLAVAYKVLLELPTGNDDVWQGNGKGTIAPALTFLKLWDAVQIAGNLGVVIPFDSDEESTLFMQSYHISYAVTESFFPLIELNHYHVLDAADGTVHFNSQVGGAVPAVATFEGGDLVNLGSVNSDGSDIVTLAVGAKSRINESWDVGGAVEFPLTDQEDSLYDWRLTLDVELKF